MTPDTLNVESVLDLQEAMAQMDGDAELLQEIVEIFVETGQEQLQSLEAGIAAGDADQVSLVAHGMKGGASNFCANRFVAAARDLEALGKEGTLGAAPELLDLMNSCFRELVEVAEVINWSEVQKNWQG